MKIEAKEHDRVDFLVWAHCGRDKGLVEKVIDASPGLAAIMYDLPAMYEFEVPDELLVQPERQVRRLW